MRRTDTQQAAMFSYLSPEQQVPPDHPLRPIRAMAETVLQGLSRQFAQLYSHTGRPSIPPEKLLRALLLQVLYTVRSERLLEGGIAQAFFDAVLTQARAHALLSDEHFTVDGTLIEAWAGQKSFKSTQDSPTPPPDDPGNPTVDFRGERRSNATHASTTDPDARLAKKAQGREAKLCYQGHLLMENRHGLAVATETTCATGTGERDAALYLATSRPGRRRITLAGDKGHDTAPFVRTCRTFRITPHVAQRRDVSAIDRRTTRHPGYPVSQRARKRVEEIFGWLKTVGGLRKTRYRGVRRVGWMFTFATAVYNLVRIRNLVEALG